MHQAPLYSYYRRVRCDAAFRCVARARTGAQKVAHARAGCASQFPHALDSHELIKGPNEYRPQHRTTSRVWLGVLVCHGATQESDRARIVAFIAARFVLDVAQVCKGGIALNSETLRHLLQAPKCVCCVRANSVQCPKRRAVDERGQQWSHLRARLETTRVPRVLYTEECEKRSDRKGERRLSR